VADHAELHRCSSLLIDLAGRGSEAYGVTDVPSPSRPFPGHLERKWKVILDPA
jgi:hypothetical protein